MRDPTDLERLQRRLAREREARKRAEQLLEDKSRALYTANQELEQASVRLNAQVLQRTMALELEHTRAQREAEFLATILDSISQGVSVFDEHLRLRNWNSNLASVLSLPPQMLTQGRTLYEFLEFCAHRGDYGPGDPETLASARLATLRDRNREGLIAESAARADGRHIELVARRLSTGGVVTTYTDITEQKRTEQTLKTQKRELRAQVEELQRLQRSLEEAHELAQAANRAKSRFVAMISHDIRTPVNGLLGSLVLLKETALVEGQRELLSQAMASGEHLRGLLADLIDLSQADAGAIRLEESSINLGEYLREIAAAWELAAAREGLAFRFEQSPDLPPTVIGDGGRIRQVLENLLSNAVKYTPGGEVALLVDQADEGIRFRVRDTGVGISPEEQRQLFEHFSRLDRTAGISRGFGLGLAITRHLVELMEGDLTLDSDLGAGSCFSVTLPLPAGEAQTHSHAAREWTQRELRTSAGGAPHLLVAEDVTTNQMIIQAYLERMGATVTLVSNGREALEAVQRHRFDLVLMDVDMPVMDGFEAIRRIRALEDEVNDIPIVIATAYADRDTRLTSLAVAIQGYVEKPIQPAFLGQAVQRALHGGDYEPMATRLETAELEGIDRERLGQTLEGVDPMSTGRFVEAALKDLSDAIQIVENATEPANLARAAHRLKSLGANFGALDVGATAARLDVLCRTPAPDQQMIEQQRQLLVQQGRLAIESIGHYLEELSTGNALP